jgi:type IV pilus assembly protein PilM
MAQTIIGLDIGSWSIKAAVIESSLRHFNLVGFVQHHIPTDHKGNPINANRSASIRATLNEVGDWESIATAVPGQRVMIRELELPFSDDKRIRSVMGFQLEDLLPRDLDELTFDYYPLISTEERSNLLCAATDKKGFKTFLAEIADADADPKLVTLDTLTYARLASHLEEIDDSEPVAFVDVGHRTTSVSVVHDGRVRTIRTIARGGAHLTEALMIGLDLDFASAEQLKHRGIRLDGSVPADADPETHAHRLSLLQQPFDALIRDLRLTLHGHRTRWETSVSRILVFGGTSRLPGLDQMLEKQLEVPVSKPKMVNQPWSQMVATTENRAEIPKAISLGLCLADQSNDHNVNFRQAELSYESDFKAFREKAGWLTFLFVLLLTAFFTRQILAQEFLEKNYTQLLNQLKAFSEQILGEPHEDFDFVLARVSRPPSEEGESIFPEMTAFRAFYEVTAAQDTINHMTISPAMLPPGPRDDPPPGVREAEAASSKVKAQLEGLRSEPNLESTGSDSPDSEEETEVIEEEAPFQLELKQIDLSLKAAQIRGEANNIESIEAFTSVLSKNPCFINVTTNDTTRLSFGDRADWLRFDLSIDIDCSSDEEEEASSEKKDEN